MRAIPTLFAACLLSGALAPTSFAGDRGAVAGPVAAAVVKVRDGDTVEVEALIWPEQTVRVAVRLRGIDAPELRARCASERVAAEAARDRLSTMLGGGPVELSRVSGDKYFGRVLASVSTRSVPDVGARLLAEGLVAPYGGGHRRDWCDGSAVLSDSNARS